MSATLLHGEFVSKMPRLIGESAPIQRLTTQIAALGRRECTALLHGESGTGKELAARLIHLKSSRAKGPFVPVDCTALRDTLLESQLFGHNRGAFTGADRSTLGFFRAAEGGTVFLDEIAELPPPSQAKLLRTIQEGTVTPLGATAGISVNVRVIAATHRDLAGMVRDGTFRQDLYYRLNVACLRLPALRTRREDIPLLIDFALADLAKVYREPQRRFTVEAMQVLCQHDWPGNVRELMNAVEHAIVFAQDADVLDVCNLPDEVTAGANAESADELPDRLMTLEEAERRLIELALKRFRGNQSQAARALKIERHRLSRRISHFGLSNLIRPSN